MLGNALESHVSTALAFMSLNGKPCSGIPNVRCTGTVGHSPFGREAGDSLASSQRVLAFESVLNWKRRADSEPRQAPNPRSGDAIGCR